MRVDGVMASTFALLGLMIVLAVVLVRETERIEAKPKAAAKPVEIVCREEVEWTPRADAIAYSGTCDGGVVVTLLK